MVTLVTGGASNVGTQIAQSLRLSGQRVKFGARSGKRIPDGFEYVLLDWDQPSTFSNPFSLNHGIKSIYLVSPMTDITSSSKMIPFIQLALDAGVKMFVYLSATIADSDNDSGGLGKIPRFLGDMLRQRRYQGLDYVILRPTWFIDNLLSEWKDDLSQKDEITTCVPNGKVPLVASSDIAQVGYEAFLYGSRHFKRRDPLIIGPELLSYTDVACVLTKVFGRVITHHIISVDDMSAFYARLYASSTSKEHLETFLQWLRELDQGVEGGSEERWAEEEGTVVGKVNVESWVRERMALFES